MKICDLKNSGGYLYHGSPFKIDILKPSQAYNFNKDKNKMIEDGKPAVSATQYLNIAIFRALVNKENAPENHWSEFGVDGGEINLITSKEVLDQIKLKKGYLHVLDEDGFTKYNGMEWRSYAEVKPL